MRCTILGLPALLTFAALPSFTLGQERATLSPELEVLRPFLGEWVGEFQNSEERPPVLRSWAAVLDGQAVRQLRTVPDFDFEAEGLSYFDWEAGTVVHLGITNNGYVTRGAYTANGDEIIQTGEQTAPDGTMGRIRVSFHFQEDGTLLNQLFNLVDGEWEPSHVILYRPAGDRSAAETPATEPSSAGVPADNPSTGGSPSSDTVVAQALLQAAWAGDEPTVRRLLEEGADPDVQDHEGHAALHLAGMAGHAAIAGLLLEHGGDPELRDDYGRTPLLLVARESGSAPAALTLLEHGAEVNALDRSGASSLELAAWRGYGEVVNLLLDHGAIVDPGGRRAPAILSFAVAKGLERLFGELEEAGAEMGTRTENGGSLLHAAAEGGSPEITRILLERGFEEG
jgi:hypothetical protein